MSPFVYWDKDCLPRNATEGRRKGQIPQNGWKKCQINERPATSICALQRTIVKMVSGFNGRWFFFLRDTSANDGSYNLRHLRIDKAWSFPFFFFLKKMSEISIMCVLSLFWSCPDIQRSRERQSGRTCCPRRSGGRRRDLCLPSWWLCLSWFLLLVRPAALPALRHPVILV